MKIGKLIGNGNTANVYEWDAGRVIKLFHAGYPNEAIEIEYHNAMAIRDMDFAKPKAYELIIYESRIGIIYDKVHGITLLDWVLKTGDVEECATTMAKLHKTIVLNHTDEVSNYKDFLRHHVTHALYSDTKQKELLQRINELPEGASLCHGDFHPGNIMMIEGSPYVIDFMNICHGNYLYDVARSVFLIEYTPVPDNIEGREQIVTMKKSLSNAYLNQMQVTREMIHEYLSVIRAARIGECPDEKVSKEG